MSETRRETSGLSRLVILLAAICLCSWGLSAAQGMNGNAAGFEIDNCGALFSGDGNTATPACTGNKLIPCQPIALGDDWAQGASYNGIFDANGMPNIDPVTSMPYRALLYTDPNWGNSSPTGGYDPSQFGGVSNKNIDPIGDPAIYVGQEPWNWNDTGGGPQKNDLTNIYAYTKVDPATGHRWLILGAETRATNGDSHVDFEVNLAGLKLCDSTGTICSMAGMDPPEGVLEGLIIGLGPDDGRTVDQDFVVSIDFVTGGSTPQTTVRQWTETSTGVFEYVLVQDLGIDITGKIFTATNNCDIVHSSGGTWTHFASNGAPTPTMLALQLVETAIDLTGLGIAVDPCGESTTIQVKTRSSQSFTAELKDFGLVSFPFEPTPACEIDAPPLVCPDEVFTATVTETTGEVWPVEFEWSITGDGTFCGGGTTAIGDTVCVDADLVCDGSITLSCVAIGTICVGEPCIYIVQVDDDVPPVITCPPDVSVECYDDIPLPDVYAVLAEDNCDEELEITWEGDVSDGETCPETITRTFRATDDCGNYAECDQLIVINDTTPPEITCPPDVTIDCLDPVPPADFAGGSASDNCVEPTVTWLGDVSEGDCPEVITRTYEAEDDCGNTDQCTQIITIVDDTPPVITCPPDVTIDCLDPLPAPDFAGGSVSDDCHEVTVTWLGDVSSGDCPEIVTRTYQAEDECGNLSTCDQIITIVDDTPPVITCPPDVTIDCLDPLPAPDFAGGSVTDDCHDVDVTWEGDVSAGDCPEVITRTYRAEDECGNWAECTQTITITDETPPVITCPPDVTIDCTDPVPAPDFAGGEAVDDCHDVTVTWEGDVSAGDCPEVITRTYRATDECGNFSECTQTITIVDDTPPVIICPPDVTIDCLDPLPEPDFAGGSVSDDCHEVTVTWLPDVAEGDCPIIVTRTYQAEDECGNISTCTQTITIVDETPPVITCPPDVTIECDEPIPAPDTASVLTSDDCHDVTVTWEGDVSDGEICPETIARTYRATDECGNWAECVQYIVIDDTTAPTVDCGSTNVVILCNEAYEFQATATDNCDVEPDIACTFASTNSAATVVEMLGNGLYRVTLTATAVVTITCVATDECGNASVPCSFEVSATCNQACSPGYWRNPVHFPEWCEAGFNPVADYCYAGPATLFADAFALTVFTSPEIPSSFNPATLTLHQAVSTSGGTFNQVLFHGSAALLNAAHPEVSAGAGVAEVQAKMQAAFSGAITFAEAQAYFAALIAQEYDGGCPID